MPVTYVALLRGINLGGKNMLPMKELVAMVSAAGCSNVRNYIQSGNVIYTAGDRVAGRVGRVVSAAIEKQFGFQTRLVIRTTEQIRQVIRSNPFLTPGVDENLLSVLFLADSPEAENVAKLDPQRSPPDQFRVVGDEIFLHTSTGLAKTKLTNAYFDSKLKTICTCRNWRTVMKLLDMMETA
jgi:uncharacterized protein (DUF1697 family)